MPELNVSDIVVDPAFAQSFKLYRKTGTWTQGRFSQTEVAIDCYGTIEINNPKDILQVPEGDRITGIITIFTQTPVLITHDGTPSGTSDEIVYKGERYRAFNSFDWSDFGFYKVIAVRMRGA